MARQLTMQRSKACLGCGLDIVDINSKDRRVLIKATDLVPLWEEILQIKLYELDPDAAVSRSTLLSSLGSAKDLNHGMMCKKCFNSYTRYHQDHFSLLENMKVLNNGALSEAITYSKGDNDAAEHTTIAGKKRSRPYSYEFPSSKRLCLMSRFNDIEATTSDSQSASPPAVVSYHSQYNNTMMLFYSLHDVCTS